MCCYCLSATNVGSTITTKDYSVDSRTIGDVSHCHSSVCVCVYDVMCYVYSTSGIVSIFFWQTFSLESKIFFIHIECHH